MNTSVLDLGRGTDDRLTLVGRGWSSLAIGHHKVVAG
jgi:hypothetical protein